MKDIIIEKPIFKDLPVDDFTQRMIDSQKVNEISNVIKSMGFVEVKRKPK